MAQSICVSKCLGTEITELEYATNVKITCIAKRKKKKKTYRHPGSISKSLKMKK